MHGSADVLVPPEHGRRVAASIPGSDYHEIDGWGHDMPLGVIPTLLGYILPFVKKAEANGAAPSTAHGRHGRRSWREAHGCSPISVDTTVAVFCDAAKRDGLAVRRVPSAVRRTGGRRNPLQETTRTQTEKDGK